MGLDYTEFRGSRYRSRSRSIRKGECASAFRQELCIVNDTDVQSVLCFQIYVLFFQLVANGVRTYITRNVWTVKKVATDILYVAMHKLVIIRLFQTDFNVSFRRNSDDSGIDLL